MLRRHCKPLFRFASSSAAHAPKDVTTSTEYTLYNTKTGNVRHLGFENEEDWHPLQTSKKYELEPESSATTSSEPNRGVSAPLIQGLGMETAATRPTGAASASDTSREHFEPEQNVEGANSTTAETKLQQQKDDSEPEQHAAHHPVVSKIGETMKNLGEKLQHWSE